MGTWLAGLAEEDVLEKEGIVLADFEASGVVPLVLLGVIDVFALGAFELDDDAIAFFLGHGIGAPAIWTQTKRARWPVNKVILSHGSLET